MSEVGIRALKQNASPVVGRVTRGVPLDIGDELDGILSYDTRLLHAAQRHGILPLHPGVVLPAE